MLLLRFIWMACDLAQPFLINRAVSYLNQKGENFHTQIGYSLIAGTGLLYLCRAVARAHTQYRLYQTLTMLRGGLVSMIYNKMTDVNLATVDESAAVTLMSTDVERILVSLAVQVDAVAGAVQVVIAIYMLQIQVGLACVAPIMFGICKFDSKSDLICS
jgi:ATP-binding cassette subfamily C (CFTR/MRP) protein 1